MSAGVWTGCGHIVTRCLRPEWPQDDLGNVQETDRRADCARNRMSGFGEGGSRRVVMKGFLLIRSHPWVCSEVLGTGWREVGWPLKRKEEVA